MAMSDVRYSKLFEEESNDELKKLLASLPKSKSLAYDVYQFNGFWYAPHHLQAVLNCQSHFKALDSDILLATSPKSGTTWLKALLFTLVNRPVKNALHALTTQNPHDLVPFLELGLYKVSEGLPDLSTITARPRLFATHMPSSVLPRAIWDSGCKIVYMCRDPRDVFISLWHFGNKLRDPKDGELSLDDAFQTFCEGNNAFGPFWDHVLGYWNRSLESPSRVLFLKYEDMKGNASGCLRQLADFLGFPFSEAEEEQGVVDEIVELCSFSSLSNFEINRTGTQRLLGVENKNFFRRGTVGDSLNYLTPEMSLQLDNIVKNKYHPSGFNYFQ